MLSGCPKSTALRRMSRQRVHVLLALSAVLLVNLPTGHALGPLTSVIQGSHPITVGPPDATLNTGHPEYVTVGGQTFLPCVRDDPAKCLAPLGLPNPGQPVQWPNVPDELFYYSFATVGTPTINGVQHTITGEVAIEGAYSSGFVDPGSRILFTRFRFIAKPALPVGNWVMQLPWADFKWTSDGVKDFHTQDRLRLPAEQPLYQPETLPLVLPDPADTGVFPDGSTTPAVDTDGYLTGPGTPVKYMFPDAPTGGRTTTKFWSVPDAVTLPGAVGAKLLGQWDTATITGRMRPLPLAVPCANPGAGSDCSSFGHTSLNVATPSKTISLDNNGADNLTLLTVAPVGPQAAAFVISAKPGANAVVGAGPKAVSVTVTCKPSAYPGPAPAAGSSVLLSAQVRFLFGGRRAFDVPVSCYLDGPAASGGGDAVAGGSTTAPVASSYAPSVTYSIKTVLSKTAIYPLAESMSVTSNVHISDDATKAPQPTYRLTSAEGNPALLTVSEPPAAPTASGVYQTQVQALWDAAGSTQDLTLQFRNASSGCVNGSIQITVKQDVLSGLTIKSPSQAKNVWRWDIRWSSAAATELAPAPVGMKVMYFGACNSTAGVAALPTNAAKKALLTTQCTYPWPGKLLFNHQCDVAANGGCRIATADGNPLFIEAANQATMTARGKVIVIWSEAGGMLPFQF